MSERGQMAAAIQQIAGLGNVVEAHLCERGTVHLGKDAPVIAWHVELLTPSLGAKQHSLEECCLAPREGVNNSTEFQRVLLRAYSISLSAYRNTWDAYRI